ncbi:hypothetical protein PspLS_08434 [Pyricularia sp. CBS 133598]|nr:hypothetical protein PspLS_08434 [Pyricularia sp. CBS 133598]
MNNHILANTTGYCQAGTTQKKKAQTKPRPATRLPHEATTTPAPSPPPSSPNLVSSRQTAQLDTKKRSSDDTQALLYSTQFASAWHPADRTKMHSARSSPGNARGASQGDPNIGAVVVVQSPGASQPSTDTKSAAHAWYAATSGQYVLHIQCVQVTARRMRSARLL